MIDPSLLLALTMETADFSQTMYIERHPTQYREANQIISSHPTPARVIGYFLASDAVILGYNYALPAKWAHALNWADVAIEGAVIGHNAHIGIKFSF